MNHKDLFEFSNPKAAYLSQEEEIDSTIKKILLSGEYVLNKQVRLLEENFAKYIGVHCALGVNSGTDALILGMRGMGIGEGDEIITTSLTASATISAIRMVGATPVYVDVDANTLNIDCNAVESRISPRTVGIIGVHLYGNPCDLISLKKIVSKNGLVLIEDCAQATGANFQGVKVGSFGNLACFSFYPTKNLGAFGDGGMIATSDENLYSVICRLRQYGWDEGRVSVEVSGVSRLDEIQAGVLNVKLTHLEKKNMRRREIANMYRKNLNESKFRITQETENGFHVYHLFTARVKGRHKLMDNMKEQGINLGIHYAVPTHKQLALRGTSKEFLPITENACEEIVSLPMYPEIENLEVERICEKLNLYAEEYYV